MTDNNLTRRTLVRSVGSAGLAGTLWQQREPAAQVNLDELVIGDDLAPPEFTRLPTPTDAPLLKKLQTELPAFVNAPIAQSAYALGEDLEEPHWMVGTIAIDIQQEYSRSTVDSAAAESYDDFISQYESETPSQIVFDQHQEFVAANSEWSAVMKKRSAFEQTTVPIFEDVLLLQYFEEVLLGTVAFAPIGFGSTATDIARGYANWQRATLLGHSTERPAVMGGFTEGGSDE
ncbi:hypothetical protein [Halobaculum litoreum]|uniref:hypothetical protein n=1 Tax=Halobaculum litoreum TaxID=3031998 RepID=UPI0024C23931|nr:hypothetical protein [Halobaculum sp. DT92]